MADPRFTIRPVSTLRPHLWDGGFTPQEQVFALMKNINRILTLPILIAETRPILCGHCRLEAMKRLCIAPMPCVAVLEHLSEAQKRACIVANNKVT